MLILQALVRSVSQNVVEETNRETGKITNIWVIQLEHTTAKGDLMLEKLKAKSQAQAEGWRKCVGKTVNVPVLTTSNGGKVYLYLTEGQLPTVQTSAADYNAAKAA
jgi:hypothetical protein